MKFTCAEIKSFSKEQKIVLAVYRKKTVQRAEKLQLSQLAVKFILGILMNIGAAKNNMMLFNLLHLLKLQRPSLQ